MFGYGNLAAALQAAGQYDEEEAVLRRASEKNLEGWLLHFQRYELALLHSDAVALEHEQKWMEQNANDPYVLARQAKIDLFEGRLDRARQRTQHGVKIALESNLKEHAASMLLSRAIAEALCGESTQSRPTVAAVMKLADSKQQRADSARLLALSGQRPQAQQMMDRLLRENPSDTLLQAVDGPVVLAAGQLSSRQADLALRTLEAVKPYEFGWYALLLPNYLRAVVYLQLRRPVEAAAEFKSVLDHRGVSPMDMAWVLSQLGLARAYVMQGDAAKAKAAYQNFLTLWKDADSDIPILKQAKAEYAKLQ
jgi:tetratricopeptide (TPR) repeat protein